MIRTIYHGSLKAAQRFCKDRAIVSIIDHYTSRPEFDVPEEHSQVLRCRFDITAGKCGKYLFDEGNVHNTVDFIIAQIRAGRDVIIHCTEGKIRSPAAAEMIYYYLMENMPDNEQVDYAGNIEEGKSAIMDRDITREIRRHLDTYPWADRFKQQG